jgi:ABC-type multidrug transport system ATPase subunit
MAMRIADNLSLHQLLVLGRPGSGCTSLLKVISNSREEFPAVHGNVRYGNIGPDEAKSLTQFMAMNTEG